MPGLLIAPMVWLRQHAWIGVIGAFTAVGAALLVVRAGLGPKVDTEPVLRRDFVQTVVASGRVEAPHRVDLGAQITGTVARVPVAEGQTVKADELLVELESAELRASAIQAEIAVQQAQARLRQLRELQAPVAEQTVRQARTTLENARAQWQRSDDLFRQGFIGAAARDEARKAVDLAEAQLRSAQAQLVAASVGGSDHALAQAALAQAQASAQAARARADYTQIRAPVDGTLIARNVEVGDVVQPGRVLLTLSPAGRTQLVVDIDEKNLHLLAIGQPAVASADAYPQQRFAAVLGYINPAVNAQTGAVQVKLDVPSPPALLRQDMTVSIDIEVARRSQALLAPIGALHEPNGRSPWALRLEAGRAVRRELRLGACSGGWCEVEHGLTEGDRLIPVAATLSAGARVRAVAAKASSP